MRRGEREKTPSPLPSLSPPSYSYFSFITSLVIHAHAIHYHPRSPSYSSDELTRSFLFGSSVSSPSLLKRVIHHELALDAVPAVQVCDRLVVPRRERRVEVDEYLLLAELIGQETDNLLEPVARGDLKLVLFQDWRVPRRLEKHHHLFRPRSWWSRGCGRGWRRCRGSRSARRGLLHRVVRHA